MPSWPRHCLPNGPLQLWGKRWCFVVVRRQLRGAALRDHVCSTVLCPYSVLWRRSWQAKLSRVQGHSYPRSTASHSHAAPNTQLIGSCSPAATPLPQEPPKVMTHHRSGFPTAAKKTDMGHFYPRSAALQFPCSTHLPAVTPLPLEPPTGRSCEVYFDYCYYHKSSFPTAAKQGKT